MDGVAVRFAQHVGKVPHTQRDTCALLYNYLEHRVGIGGHVSQVLDYAATTGTHAEAIEYKIWRRKLRVKSCNDISYCKT